MVLNKGRILALLLVVVTFVGCGENEEAEEEAELKIEDLIVQLGDPDSYIALKASEKLIEVGEPAVPELVKVLSLPGVENRRKLTLQTLQNIGDPAVEYLVPLLDDPSLRLEARDIIMGIGTTTALQILTKSLIAQLGSSYAFQGLVEIGKPAVPELIKELNVPDVGDQKAHLVIRVLKAIKTPKALEAVKAFAIRRPGVGVAVVVGTFPASGGEIAANGVLIINFDNGFNIDPVGAITVNGVLVEIFHRPYHAAIHARPCARAVVLPDGSAVLNIAWKNMDGTDGAASVTVKVKAEDNTAPTVKGGTVENGAKDVDPGPINEAGKIEIIFSEVVIWGVVSLRLKEGIPAENGGDVLGTQVVSTWGVDKTDMVTIALNAGVVLANETSYVITVKNVQDGARNEMAKNKNRANISVPVITFTTKRG